MSFTITKPGPHKQRDGGKADIRIVDGEWAIGFRADGHPCFWRPKNGYSHGCSNEMFSIAGPWHDIPEPPAGFVVMPQDYVGRDGDKLTSSGLQVNLLEKWCNIDAANRGRSSKECDLRFEKSAPFYIASPIPAPPKIDPGEGWRLLEDGEIIESGDDYFDFSKMWCRPHAAIGLAVHAAKKRWPDLNIAAYRRRIPAPFRISDKGCGIYQTRDGRQEPVTRVGLDTCGDDESPTRWYLDGRATYADERPYDLVRYIGPLPAPETFPVELGKQVSSILSGKCDEPEKTPKFIVGDKVRTQDGYGFDRKCTVKVVPGVAHSDYLVEDGGWSAWRSPSALEAENETPETWTPCELRWSPCKAFDDMAVWLWVRNGGDRQAHILEQRWTYGERSEWRPASVEAAT